MHPYVNRVYQELERDYPYQKEYLQAAHEILSSFSPLVEKRPELEKMKVLERFVRPDLHSFPCFLDRR